LRCNLPVIEHLIFTRWSNLQRHSFRPGGGREAARRVTYGNRVVHVSIVHAGGVVPRRGDTRAATCDQAFWDQRPQILFSRKTQEQVCCLEFPVWPISLWPTLRCHYSTIDLECRGIDVASCRDSGVATLLLSPHVRRLHVFLCTLVYCGYTTYWARNRQIWKCVWPKNTMSYKTVLYDLNTEFSTKFSTKFSTPTTAVVLPAA
jgi:hypothetical protein